MSAWTAERAPVKGTEYCKREIVLELGNGNNRTTCNDCEHTEFH